MTGVQISQSAPSEGRTEGDLDLGALMRGISRKRFWILGTTLAAFALSFAVVSIVQPRYTGEAKVILETQDNYFTRPGKDPVAEVPQTIDDEAVQSQVQLVTSRDLARQAIRKLNLLGNPEFDPLAAGMSPITRLLVILGLQRDPRDVSPEDRMLDAYYDRLTVFPVARSRVLTIEFTSQDPEFAAKAANTIAELYLNLQEQAKRNNAQAAGQWLAPTIVDLRSKVADAEAKVQAFRAKSGLIEGPNNTTISTLQLGELSTQLAAARSAQAEAQAKAKLIRQMVSEGRVADVTDVANNELIRNIAQQAVTLRGQLALESRSLLPGHPRIQELNAQLADVNNALRAAAEKAARGLETDARIAGERVDVLTATLDAQKKTVADGNDQSVELGALQRDATAARDQLEAYLQKYREATARLTENSVAADGRIISRAIAPELPSFPKKVPTVLIATLAGLFLSLGVVVTRELLSGRAHLAPEKDMAPVPESAGDYSLEGQRKPVAAAVSEEDPLAVHSFGHDAGNGDGAFPDMAEVVHRFEAAKREAQAHCVLVCGVDRGSGATAAAIELARTLASEGRAIIVDFDRSGPGLDRFVGDSRLPGLAELVVGEQSFTEAIHRDRGSRLHILPAGQGRPVQEADGTETERLNLVIDALVATYDYIVLTGSPLADNDVSLDLAAWTDSVVLVTAFARDDRNTRVAFETLAQAGATDIQVLASVSEAPVERELSAA
jgi:uncharacterized protein involved in exopolysaccharide biosynthesis